VQAIGERGKIYMTKRKRKKLSDEPIGRIKIKKDFLPTPDKLLVKSKPIKVTITLSQDSIDFFKQVANKEHVPYQKLIRALLDRYASQYR
jgi:predicted DNA binding CopG/RHH family protein